MFRGLFRGQKTNVYANSDSGREIMDEKQQKQVNEAAEKFAEALKESYQSIADRSVSAQELNAQVTQDFFNGVINNLRTQAENNRALSDDLIEQQRKQQEASQALAQESLGAYMDFLNSMFSYYRGNLDEAQRRTRQ
jgi:polyhydroxyalkanoate synthesis regulator phasin